MRVRNWIANVQRKCYGMFPHCADPNCGFGRSVGRQLRWWAAKLRLHDSFYCSPQCFEKAARQRFVEICASPAPERLVQHRIPLGLLMLSRGQLSNGQLRQALEAQRANGSQRIGEWVQKLGFASEQQVTNALGVQWACPVLHAKVNPFHPAVRLVPRRILERYRMLPIQFVESTRTFYVAFSEDLDYSILYALEQMLDCRTQPSFLPASVLAEALEQIGRDREQADLLFEGWRYAPEMARITCTEVLKLGAQSVRIHPCGCYIWARLCSGEQAVNLIFRRPAALPQEPADAADSYARITG